MNASPLPDDINEWPQSPYEVLGVESNASQDVIKRAYSSLIRRFKPDQFPAEFQRIRAAYDALKRGQVDGLLFYRPGHGLEQIPLEQARSRTPGPNVKERSHRLSELWQSVRSGDVKQAYRDLVSLNQADSGDEQVYVRLFWLCALFPQVDRGRRPGQWLLAGLRQAQSITALGDLWEMELRHSPVDAIGDEMLALIASNPRSRPTFEFLRSRWEAAYLIGRPRQAGPLHDEIIVADVQSLRSSVLAEDTRLWIEVLSQAAERLAWSAREAGRIESAKYVDEMEHLIRVGDFRWPLERLELAVIAAREWHGIEGSYADWLRPICACWLCPASEAEVVVRRILGELALDPHIALCRLDYVRQHAPVLLWRLDQMAASSAARDTEPDEDRMDGALKTTIQRYLQQTGLMTYREWRLPLLEFLIAQCLQPAQVAAVIESSRNSKTSSAGRAATQLREDVSLRCICHAYQVFWRTA